jgi:acyl carrier protein phosphodiesterase
MNYLAHLHLASNEPEAVIGSLMGDFVKGRVDPAHPPVLRHAILQHRRIDSFTDAHPLVKRSKQRIRPEFRRYAGILIDVFYDHFLATEWRCYAEVSLDEFTEYVYAQVSRHLRTLPSRMQLSMRYMMANDLLRSYRTVGGIGRALRGIETRLRRPSRLGEAVTELEGAYLTLRDDFTEFFPQLIRFVDEDEDHSRSAGPAHRRLPLGSTTSSHAQDRRPCDIRGQGSDIRGQ